MTITLKNPTGKPSEAAFNYAMKLTIATTPKPDQRVAALSALSKMNAQDISTVIDMLKPIVAAQGPTKATTMTEAPAKQAVPGHYMVDGTHYIVKKSKTSGVSYLCSYWGGYLGAKGAAAPILAKIVTNGAEYAIAYAKATGKCGICNTKLTDPKSIAAGIGPTCAKKF